MSFPTRATMFHDEALPTVGNALLRGHDSTQDYAIYSRQNTAANGDTFTNSFMLKAGTYTFKCLGYGGFNNGKIDWYVDDVLIATGQDWYAASGTANTVKTVSSVSIVGSGRHVLKGVINGKNASSSNYQANLTKYWFEPASDDVEI